MVPEIDDEATAVIQGEQDERKCLYLNIWLGLPLKTMGLAPLVDLFDVETPVSADPKCRHLVALEQPVYRRTSHPQIVCDLFQSHQCSWQCGHGDSTALFSLHGRLLHQAGGFIVGLTSCPFTAEVVASFVPRDNTMSTADTWVWSDSNSYRRPNF